MHCFIQIVLCDSLTSAQPCDMHLLTSCSATQFLKMEAAHWNELNIALDWTELKSVEQDQIGLNCTELKVNVEWNGVFSELKCIEVNWTEWDRTEWNRFEQKRLEQNLMAQKRTEQNRSELNRFTCKLKLKKTEKTLDWTEFIPWWNDSHELGHWWGRFWKQRPDECHHWPASRPTLPCHSRQNTCKYWAVRDKCPRTGWHFHGQIPASVEGT